MKITKRKVVILRGGVVTEDSIRKGGKVDTVDKISKLSVQASDGEAKMDDKTKFKLLAAIPNDHYALTFSGNILDKGGIIETDPLEDNPYHALVSNITVEELYEIFKINKW